MPNPKCVQCHAVLNIKWGKNALTGEKYTRGEWRCPCPAQSLMKCKTCCGCRTSAWGGGSNRGVVVQSSVHPAPPSSSSHDVTAAGRSRSPPRAVAKATLQAVVRPLTSEQRGLRFSVAEVKERRRAQYRRLPGGQDRANWPLPGRAQGDDPGARDARPYRGVAGGRWADGIWLDHVASVLDTPLWAAHRQVWSVTEEMFVEWAEVERERLLGQGAAPGHALFTRHEQALRRRLQANADLAGVQIARRISDFL